MPNVFEKYDVIFFDLDDTLYPEIEYLQAAFGAIGQFFEKKHALNARQMESFLTTTFKEDGRQNLFNQCFNHFKEEINAKNLENTEGGLSEKIFINMCLDILRTVKIPEKIALFPYVYPLIPQLLKEKKQIFVLTNGNVSQQKNKINSINWASFADSITFVFANEFAPKPSAKVFTDFLEPHFKLRNRTMLFIGDAQTDEQFCQNIGIDFLHVDFLNI
jgi:phosphoglycolate phosphatase-like HAD superfamily hydrolase